MNEQDIRCEQRFSIYCKAMANLEETVLLANKRPLSDLEEQGLIQAFEITHELAWKTLEDFIENQGTVKFYGSKDAVREAFQIGLIENGDAWMDMIKRRNETSHTYNAEVAAAISEAILHSYFREFKTFEQKMNDLSSNGAPIQTNK